MFASEVKGIYEGVLQKYQKRGFLHPELALNSDIQSLMHKGGKTQEQIILYFYRLMVIEGKTREETILRFQTDLEQGKEEMEKELNKQVAHLKEKIDILTLSFSKGEISQETYLTAVKTLENEINKIKGETEAPIITKQALTTDFRATPYENAKVEKKKRYYSSPSALWWLVPFFFGLIGGIIAYVAVKDEDEDKAKDLLIFGIVWSIVEFLFSWFILTRL